MEKTHYNKMKDHVIEVLDQNHGQKVKAYWEQQGVNVEGYYFYMCKSDGDECRYYGLINGRFENYNITTVNQTRTRITTLEDFRPIIGYRLIKPEYAQAACQIEGYNYLGEIIRDGKPRYFEYNLGDGNPLRKKGFDKLEKAGVLDLWFEPVYPEEDNFKIGDIVYVEDGGRGCSMIQGFIGKIIKPPKSTPYRYGGAIWGRFEKEFLHIIPTSGFNYVGLCEGRIMRKATPEEIQKYNNSILPAIGKYQGEDTGDAIKFGCTQVKKETLKNLFKELDVESITVKEDSKSYIVGKYTLSTIKRYLGC